MYFLRIWLTNLKRWVARCLSLCASSIITKSYSCRKMCSAPEISSSRSCISAGVCRFFGSRSREIEAITLSRSQSSSFTAMTNSSPNFVSSSSCHWLISDAGVRIRIRLTNPRANNSFMIIAASMVLPSPTSSANNACPRIEFSTVSAVCN